MKTAENKLKGKMLSFKNNFNKQDKARTIGQKLLKIVFAIMLIILLVGLSYIILQPLLFIISMAFKDPIDFDDKTIFLINKHWTLGNVKAILDNEGLAFWKSLGTSFMTSVIPTLLTVVSCSLAGYGFARFKFRGKGILFGCLLFTIIVPIQTIIIPIYMNYAQFSFFGIMKVISSVVEGFQPYINLTDTYWVFYLPAILCFGIRGSLFVFIYRQFFSSFPAELEEAAYIDGCGPVATFVRILIPNAIPAILTVTLFSLVWYYNDIYQTNMFMANKRTLAMAIDQFKGFWSIKIQSTAHLYVPYQNALLIMFMTPLIILFIVAQRKFIEGVERSGIVG